MSVTPPFHKNHLFLALILTAMVSGCATVPVPTPHVIKSDAGAAFTPTMLGKVSDELKLAEASYNEEDYMGAQQACARAGRLLYGVHEPEDGNASYFNLQSKCALLTLRLNHLLYQTAPDLDPDKFTMPIPYNPRIEKQLEGFLTYGRESFARWLRRSGKYVPALKTYFKEQGLPEDLVYLALIESGFNPRNRSSKEAVGLFQFIRDTAEMVGLKETYWIDERRHPEKAAEAAVQHLRSLYKTFQDWDLALAAYNAGAGRVKQAIKSQGKKDYWELALPPETEAYVPKFYAALIIAREPELYGFNPKLEEANVYEDVSVPGGVDLKVVAEAAGVTLNVVKDLNPELTKGCTPPGDEPYSLKLPVNCNERFRKNFSTMPDEKKFLSKEELSRRRFSGVYVVYKVKSGDSLFTIAKKHNTTVAKIQKWNASTKTRKYIHPGQKLRIYRMQ